MLETDNNVPTGFETKGAWHDRRAYLLEIIADIQLVGVKEQQNEVTPCSKPATDIDEVEGALNAMFLS